MPPLSHEAPVTRGVACVWTGQNVLDSDSSKWNELNVSASYRVRKAKVLTFSPMRGSNSLPRLPPVKVSASNSNAPSTSSIEPSSKQRTATASPFSTSALESNETASLSRRQSSATGLDTPHSASSRDRPQRASSYWANKFQSQSKADFVRGDVAPLLERFEDTALYRHPHRKPLQSVLDDLNSSASREQGDSKRSLSCRQASDLAVIHRHYPQDSVAKTIVKKNYRERVKASALEPPAKVVPTRFLFEGTRCERSSRCDYCNFAGGELECAACNVVAHARCYLAAYAQDDRKTKLTFVVPTTAAPFSSWLCAHCQSDLTLEYDERAADARAVRLAAQRQVLASALTAYVRMMKDANTFATKKAAIIRIQATLRGRQARQRFERLQRMRLKPYAIDALRVRVVIPSDSGNLSAGLGLGVSSSSSSLEELRLGNGFSCNPFMYVTVVAGNDEDTQLFCFETSVRKPISGSAELDIVWPEKMFVPGADGNATFCFTLLSKNGPNTFFLGQAVLRLLDTGDCWRTGVATELELQEHVEIFPKTAQHQPLSLADAGGNAPKLMDDMDDTDRDAETGTPHWLVNVHLRPFGEQHSHCGYLNMKSTLESFHTSARWCVLADGILRIYRHFGVTLASDVVDMAHATDVRVVPILSSAHRVATSKVKTPGLTGTSEGGAESVAEGTGTKVRGHKSRPRLAEHCCLAVHHLSRLYLFQSEHNEQLRAWLKKLQGAQKFSSLSSQAQPTHAPPVAGS
ncbi:hypothetical protein PHYPSEUDO_006717 [Phytophthora pseudosyringae]|uniref:PH domain-containing protein n=1 Tax=Phytophthora pseudosyringae TaxID=221518 RepID=A0A8T1VI44_9STRA|nr:hypothetical protein PHYPSEUDO_006717 [Phytophthora pseudosyringae]